ncbi:MAG: bifunctional phosphoribosylaminoimidazolecarboxamide formyltransferase/IMP cyclohydrolase, partial [Betaproteobacteria bacterium]|nr:bifunctional phosphoribosylaminoimidazolecarboxamide formyltransferase/IMP cyclohydrolase [Betaproteobacteria bacterium]
MKIRQALISVSDKRGVLEFAQGLAAQGVQLLSTGGTAKMLRDAGLAVTEIGDYTGFPEMLDGRVKTLHPKVHGGILARRDLPEHLATIEQHGIPTIDLVCVNLYPFRETVAKPNVTLEDAIENIDIGGPAMVRSSAKNYAGVAIVTDPADYQPLLDEMKGSGGALTLNTRFGLAKKAFTHTARYDSAIANWLTSLDEQNKPQQFPAAFHTAFDRIEVLRYGENPHQQAAFYKDPTPTAGAIANYTQLQGKELSYNNIADADAAWECVKTFAAPACVIIKHANPCGVAIGAKHLEAYEKAFKTDSTSAFGGIIAFNGTVDVDVVNAMNERKHFVEVLIAPGFTPAAKELLAGKTNLRVLEVPLERAYHAFELKRVGGGLLVQTPDMFNVQPADLKVVTKKAPTDAQLEDLLFAYRVAKFVKSNAIVFCGGGMT